MVNHFCKLCQNFSLVRHKRYYTTNYNIIKRSSLEETGPYDYENVYNQQPEISIDKKRKVKKYRE